VNQAHNPWTVAQCRSTVDSWRWQPRGLLERLPCDAAGLHNPPRIERDGEGGSTKLTENFTDRQSDGDGSLTKRGKWWQWSSVLGALDSGGMELRAARDEVVSGGLRVPFIGWSGERRGWEAGGRWWSLTPIVSAMIGGRGR
jgi:hypothetical protein